MRRILFDIVVAFLYFGVGWRWAIALAVVGVFFFPRFVELVVLAIFIDGAFGTVNAPAIYLRTGFLSIVTLILYFFAQYARRHVRWYES